MYLGLSKETSEQKYFWETDKSKRRHPGHPAVKAFSMPKINTISEIIGDMSRMKVIDIGCGNGFFQYYLKDAVGLDFSKAMLLSTHVSIKYMETPLICLLEAIISMFLFVQTCCIIWAALEKCLQR